METVLLVVLLLITLAMIVVILLQRSEGGALGMGGGGAGGGGMFTARGTANIMTRMTAILGAGFMVTCLALAVIASQGREPSSVLDRAPATAPAETQTDQPAVPVSE